MTLRSLAADVFAISTPLVHVAAGIEDPLAHVVAGTVTVVTLVAKDASEVEVEVGFVEATSGVPARAKNERSLPRS